MVEGGTRVVCARARRVKKGFSVPGRTQGGRWGSGGSGRGRRRCRGWQVRGSVESLCLYTVLCPLLVP